MKPMDKPTTEPAKQTGQGTGDDRLGRHRGLRAQYRPHDRGRRQGARRLSEAARGRRNQRRDGRRHHRRGQDRRPSRGILALRSAARARTANAPRPRLPRSVGQHGQAHGRRRDRRRSPRPIPRTSALPIRNGRRTSSSISSSRPICSPRNGPSSWSKTPTASTSTRAQKAEFYVKQIANAISPSNFVLTNPELLRETLSSNAEISCAACTCWPRTSRPATAI